MLGKGDQLFKYIGRFTYLGIEDLPQDLLIVNSINGEFLESKIKKLQLDHTCYLLQKLYVVFSKVGLVLKLL